jgi:hypothetical protein
MKGWSDICEKGLAKSPSQLFVVGCRRTFKSPQQQYNISDEAELPTAPFLSSDEYYSVSQNNKS